MLEKIYLNLLYQKCQISRKLNFTKYHQSGYRKNNSTILLLKMKDPIDKAIYFFIYLS